MPALFSFRKPRYCPWLILPLFAAAMFFQLAIHAGAAHLPSGPAPSPLHGPALARAAAQSGMWAAPISLGMVPIHAVLLYTGNVLFWEYASSSGVGGTKAILFDPSTGSVTSLPAGSLDFFCAGQSQLAHGKILIDGGLNGPLGHGALGIPNSILFDPATSSWEHNSPMGFARYYPTNVQLGDGSSLVLSGDDASGNLTRPVEQFNPANNTWSTLPSSANLPGHWDNYPRVFLLPSGQIFMAGQTNETWLLDPSSAAWTDVGPTIQHARYGEGAVLFPDFVHVMVIGGQMLPELPSNTTEMIDLSQPVPSWQYSTPMNFARHDLNAIQLPDGSLLVVGGAAASTKYGNPVKQAELYNPLTSSWSLLAAQQGSRGYHSVALLLPDATVLSAGSDSGDSLQTYAEIFSPPYLFQGPRPVISSAPAAISYAHTFTVATPDAAGITSAVLIRTDAATHADHFDQRLVQLAFSIGHSQLTLTAPASGNYAPPGYYMLFLINTAGVPSLAPILRLD